MKTFEELMKGIDEGPKDLPEGKEITDEEIEIRLQIFFNGMGMVEKSLRKSINNLSFQVNKKVLEGCQGEDLIQFYNERVGALLDDFIF